MEKKILSKYYQHIIDLILNQHENEFTNAKPGHCMKITGLGEEQMSPLLERVRNSFPDLDSFIINEEEQNDRFISATKLIELRNRQIKPLLILVPSNSRTAAEDSYGNATFKEISLANTEHLLLKKLLKSLSADVKNKVKQIFEVIVDLKDIQKINFLLSSEEEDYSDSSLGRNLFHLGLLPDIKLFEQPQLYRSRLNLNLDSCSILSSFNRPVYDRVNELKIEKDTLQGDWVQLFKNEKGITSQIQLAKIIANNYESLWFNHWEIPNLNFDEVKLEVLHIKSPDLKVVEGKNVLTSDGNSNPSLTIRFTTYPEPKNLSELKFFRVILMKVNGGSGEEISTLRKLKNSNSRSNYRDAKVELNKNNVEEGSYFLKVLAEDEHGNILNSNDDFLDLDIQKEWEESNKSEEKKKELDFKLKCDSQDFDYFIDPDAEEEETQRKLKLNNVLQAFFKFNVDGLKENLEITSPEPSEFSNQWIGDKNLKQTSTFHINYSQNHNYQINLSSKLRLIENELLNNAGKLGFIEAKISNNNTTVGLSDSEFHTSSLNELAPKKLLAARQDLFEKIIQSNKNENGVFETVNLYELKDAIQTYVNHYTKWLKKLKKEIENSNGEDEETKLLYTEVQFLDVVKLKSKLPDESNVYIILLPPLHPLRLIWFLQLIEQFEEWHKKSIDFEGHKKEWSHLEELFIGELYPMNQPLVLVDPNQFTNYEYLGELCYGWGIYVNTALSDNKDSLVPVSHQLKYYFRHLLNIDSKSINNKDVSETLIVRHLKNYLLQHPYTETLIINLFNVGDAEVFVNAFVGLSKFSEYQNIRFHVRIFVGNESIMEHGLALKNLLNPETTVSEEAELFSQASKNRLFPKLRYSINSMEEFIENPMAHTAHMSILVNPFNSEIRLYKPYWDDKSDYLKGLILDSATEIEINENGDNISWYNYVKVVDKKQSQIEESYQLYQAHTSGALAAHPTEAIPATYLNLSNRDKVLITHLHECSDWVITVNKNLGPEIFDQPSENGEIPFLLDFVPGEDITGISSYLTTKPSSEIIGLISPHFKDFGIEAENPEHLQIIEDILEDIRAVSSTLVMQLNSSENRAFEAIGTAFSKRVLEKKKMLEDAFLIPIDLHKNLFEDAETQSKSRADCLFVSINPEKREINIGVLEIKCRTYLGSSEREELKSKMITQIENTIKVLKQHFDPNNFTSEDRLDREIKNKELHSILDFYIERAHRYGSLSDNAYNSYHYFIQTLNDGFELKFNKLGFIFDFSFDQRHQKQLIDDKTTIFTFGQSLIKDILDRDSDLNTRRIEEAEIEKDLKDAFDTNRKLKPFIQKMKSRMKKEDAEENPVIIPEENNDDKDDAQPVSEDNQSIIEDKPVDPVPSVSETEESPIEKQKEIINNEQIVPDYDILLGKSSPSNQFGIIGTSIHNKKLAIDITDTNTISLFGIQGGGKSYTIGTMVEMTLKPIPNINSLPSPLAGVIFHYSESMDYEPEFATMKEPNSNLSEIEKLKDIYGANPDRIEDVIILTPEDKLEERKQEFPNVQIEPIAFNSMELNVQDWLFLLGAIGNDSAYIKQLKFIMKEHRKNITIEGLRESVENSDLLSNTQKSLARQKLSFAQEYINDDFYLKDLLRPGRLLIVDLRDEFIVKDEALGLFVIMLNIFSNVRTYNEKHFNKFIVFDEAHKYMDNKDLTNNIVTAIREMRHKGVSIMIASQDPPSLPNEIIELSSIVLLHKFNSPQWLRHVQKSLIQINTLKPEDLSILKPGEAFIWASKATEGSITRAPVKIMTRPRVTQHGGSTKKATGNE